MKFEGKARTSFPGCHTGKGADDPRALLEKQEEKKANTWKVSKSQWQRGNPQHANHSWKRWQTHPGTSRDDGGTSCESQAEHGPGVSLT